METAFTIYQKSFFCMIHEQIPEDMLSILCYDGDSNYMLLASVEENRKSFHTTAP